MVQYVILETGTAVIAVSLPVLHHLIGSQAVQSMINTVRGVISLRSLALRRSSDSNKATQGRKVLHADGKALLQAAIGQGEANTVGGSQAAVIRGRCDD